MHLSSIVIQRIFYSLGLIWIRSFFQLKTVPTCCKLQDVNQFEDDLLIEPDPAGFPGCGWVLYKTWRVGQWKNVEMRAKAYPNYHLGLTKETFFVLRHLDFIYSLYQISSSNFSGELTSSL